MSLCEELKVRAEESGGLPLRSIYIGGGTPSTLRKQEIEDLFRTIGRYYTIAPDAEVTFEANPDDLSLELIATLREVGVNRVSLGVQSFDDGILRLLRRRHNGKDAINGVNLLASEGIENISIDLIYGLPRQTAEMFSRDLDTAFSLPIRHLSSYALSIEDGTPLSRMLGNGTLLLSEEEVYLNAYERLMEKAREEGFEHYEISNFALPGYRSRHNSAYWDGTPYIGVGPAAHSFDGGTRRRVNLPDLKAYIASPGRPAHEVEVLSRVAQFDERVFTALRTQDGLKLKEVEMRFGTTVLERLLREAAPSVKRGLLTLDKEKNVLRLTRKGLFVSDDVMSDLMQGE